MVLINFCCSFSVVPQFIYLFLYLLLYSISEAEITETMQLRHFHRYHAFRSGDYNSREVPVFHSLANAFLQSWEVTPLSSNTLIRFHCAFPCTEEPVGGKCADLLQGISLSHIHKWEISVINSFCTQSTKLCPFPCQLHQPILLALDRIPLQNVTVLCVYLY